MMLGPDTSTLAQILGIPTAESRETAMQLTGYTSSLQEGDFRAVVEKYGRLKPAMQNLPFTYSIYIQALQQLSNTQPDMNETYAQALEKARGILGEDVTIDLLLVDMHFIRGDMPAARKDVENALKTIGDDSYLHHLSGLMCVRTDDLAGAEAALAKAEKIQPDLIDLVDLRMMLFAMKKDYAGLVKSMEDFSAKTGAKLTPELLNEAVYDDFKKSPEFTKWAEGLKK
jgi:tetratricopeptide (TPR) repeat protein